MALLNAIKVLDFSTLLPGPYATMMLADLGAEVLRVESPTRPDLLRNFNAKDGEDSTAHQYINRSKKSIALDLKKPESIDLVKQLIEEYDIVLEQFRPGVMEALGLSYEELKLVNPGLIYCSLTGYGQNGPYRDRPGHDNNFLAISGIASYSARKESRPIPMGIQIADIAGGSLHTVIAILAAIIHRKETGEGQYVDVSMTDTAFALNTLFGPGYLTAGIDPEPEMMELNGGTFYDYYETKDGRYFSVGSLEPAFKKQLCEAIGQPELIELGMSESFEDIDAFKKKITIAFLGKTYEEWTAKFANMSACVEPVLKFSEACEHSQIKARKMIVEVPKADGTFQRQIACPIKFSAFMPEYKHIGVNLGAHTKEILKDLEKRSGKHV
ncbi:Crotonobetainyl-CoA:carnitine CoA-transferase CaiB [Paenibacillus sp. yr247]|uniref:CaiB/BaiF CoA transferase family protein n=1 Tax=Paenibacillus sp. yr247 TaxID=1761880 RepID=UPI00087E1ED9|nr:CaiB/BaiF CoA-transferase family protein [Paenibacillus sp. yr247]SDN95506.1 Crotonobetainyl-CoA:carnitine CoA-transferase CaiB [Paenibacillus sp. yr247]